MAGSSKACPPRPGIDSGLPPGSPVAVVEAFRCSDMSVHPTRMIAEAHEADLVAEQRLYELRNTLYNIVDNSHSLPTMDEGDCMILAQRLMQVYDITRKVQQ